MGIEQVAVNVIGDLDRGMTHQLLDFLRVGAAFDLERGTRMTQALRRVFRLAVFGHDPGLEQDRTPSAMVQVGDELRVARPVRKHQVEIGFWA